LGGFSQINLDLPEVDALNKKIAAGINIVGVGAVVVGAVVASPLVGGAVASAAAGTAAQTAVKAGTGTVAQVAAKAVDAADTVSDIASIVSNQKAMRVIREGTAAMSKGMTAVDQYDRQLGAYVPAPTAQKKGALEGLVSMVTEKSMAKPQRARKINEFIINTLQPEFKQQINQISGSIVSTLQTTLSAESEEQFNQIKAGLENLNAEKQRAKNEFDQKINTLLMCKKELEA
jgi:hypothetical protein